MFKMYFINLLFLFPFIANVQNYLPFDLTRGDEIGNGGDVIVCEDKNNVIKSVELLDFYEAREFRNINYFLGGENLTELEKAEFALKRIKILSPERFERYSNQLKNFFNNALFLNNINLEDISDSNHIFIPKGCRLEQIAVNQKKLFPEDKTFIINKELWDMLDNNNKAGLILHEIIFTENINLDSRKVRYFNSYLTSSKIDNYTREEFIDLLKIVGLKTLSIQGVLHDINHPPEYFENGFLKRIKPINKSIYRFHGQKLRVRDEEIKFYENGKVKSIWFYDPFFYKANGFELLLGRSYIHFYDNEKVRWADVYSSKEITSSNYSITLSSSDYISLDRYGNILEFFGWGNFKIKNGSIYIKNDQDESNRIELFHSGMFKAAFLKTPVKIILQGKEVDVSETINFFESGHFEYGTILNNENFILQQKRVSFKANTPLWFYDQDRVRCGFLAKNTWLNHEEKGLKRFKKNTEVCFDINTQNVVN